MEIVPRGKKAVFFTFMAIFLTILIVAVFYTRESYRYREKSSAIASRINTMDNFLRDVESDLDRELFIGGYRSILSMNKYLRTKEGFISDVDETYAEILSNGTANGSIIDLMKLSVDDETGADLTSWATRLSEEASKVNIEFTFIPNRVQLTQSDPWSVNVVLNATIIILDRNNLAKWNTTKIYTKNIGIQGFEDPLYTINSKDRVINLITLTNYTVFVNDSDATNLYNHLTHSYYTNNSMAPSYLMRFVNDSGPSPYGIESMVNLEDFQRQSLDVYLDRSVMDYLYFNGTETGQICGNSTALHNITWFRIDDAHAGMYQADSIEVSCS